MFPIKIKIKKINIGTHTNVIRAQVSSSVITFLVTSSPPTPLWFWVFLDPISSANFPITLGCFSLSSWRLCNLVPLFAFSTNNSNNVSFSKQLHLSYRSPFSLFFFVLDAIMDSPKQLKNNVSSYISHKLQQIWSPLKNG